MYFYSSMISSKSKSNLLKYVKILKNILKNSFINENYEHLLDKIDLNSNETYGMKIHDLLKSYKI